jgi:hypothetical protein
MNWLRSNWKHVGLVVVLVVTVAGWISTAHYRGIAMAEAAEGERQTAVIERQARELAEGAARDSAAEAALALARENDARRLQEIEAARRGEQAARDSLARLARAEADSTDGWVRVETHEASIAAERRETARADSSATVWQGRAERAETHAAEILQPRITALTAQVVRLEARDETRLRQIDALERAVAPSFAVRLLDNWELVALGALVGVVGWEVAR